MADHQWAQDTVDSQHPNHLGRQMQGALEEDAPELVDIFLRFVHIKNPILEIKVIREDARRIAENGFEWDARSCIVVS